MTERQAYFSIYKELSWYVYPYNDITLKFEDKIDGNKELAVRS